MPGQVANLLIETVFGLFIYVVLLRFWMQALRASFRTPVGQFVVALTSWAVLPARRVVPSFRQYDLASFAVPTITGEIKKHLRDRSTVVRIPRRLAELSALLRVRREVLAARLSRPPTVSELAQELGVGEDDVVEAMETERVRVPLGLSTADAEALKAVHAFLKFQIADHKTGDSLEVKKR